MWIWSYSLCFCHTSLYSGTQYAAQCGSAHPHFVSVTGCSGWDFTSVFCHIFILFFSPFDVVFTTSFHFSQRPRDISFYISSWLLVLQCRNIFFDLVHLVLSMLFLFPPEWLWLSRCAYCTVVFCQQTAARVCSFTYKLQMIYRFAVKCASSWFPLIAVRANMAFHTTENNNNYTHIWIKSL